MNLLRLWTARDAKVPQSVVDDDAHCIGQIQAADVLAEDGDLVQLVGVLGQQVFGQSDRFLAKDEKHVVSVIDVVMRLCALAREKRKVGILVNGHEGFQALVSTDV